jgi:dipeptidase D
MTTERILAIFSEIICIPRESGNEQHIIAYLQEFASKNGLDCKTDPTGNVLITKEATPGRESSPTIILQSHSDMVCEKNSGVEHDFAKDPIKAVIEDGWMIAKDTTLGADCGIGVAASLALLEDNTIEHGKIEALFTVSEETGMDGAFGLTPDFMSGSILINLDSEDEGELFIGCAGGVDTTAHFDYTTKKIDKELLTYKIGFCGGVGGHSGDDIDKGRANAIQLLSRSLYKIMKEFNVSLCAIDGGNKRNAIAREAYAIIALKGEDLKEIKKMHMATAEDIKTEYAATEPNIAPIFEAAQWDDEAIDTQVALNLISCFNSAPHGVLAMSQEMKGLVETSTNLASVKMTDGKIRVGTSQRSSINSARHHAAEKVEAIFLLAGAEVTHEGEYPGWKPQLKSPVLELTKKGYRELFGVEPVVRAIHAGLECGLILDKYPSLDMISFGPTIRGVHAPGERLDLASVDKFNKLLEYVIVNCK